MKYKDPFIESVAEIVTDVLVDLRMYSKEAMELVMRTGAAESGYRSLEQHPTGPGLGFWQIESGPANKVPMLTAEGTWYNFIVFRSDIRERIHRITGIEKGPYTRFQLLSNIALQAVLCRLKYWRDPNPIPETLEEQAAYWKSVYNPEGKGTVEKFIAAAKEMEVEVEGQD